MMLLLLISIPASSIASIYLIEKTSQSNSIVYFYIEMPLFSSKLCIAVECNESKVGRMFSSSCGTSPYQFQTPCILFVTRFSNQ